MLIKWDFEEDKSYLLEALTKESVTWEKIETNITFTDSKFLSFDQEEIEEDGDKIIINIGTYRVSEKFVRFRVALLVNKTNDLEEMRNNLVDVEGRIEEFMGLTEKEENELLEFQVVERNMQDEDFDIIRAEQKYDIELFPEVAELVYVSTSENIKISSLYRIYLPQIISEDYLIQLDLYHIGKETTPIVPLQDIWELVKDGRYVRITDAEPLDILEIAGIWLFFRIQTSRFLRTTHPGKNTIKILEFADPRAPNIDTEGEETDEKPVKFDNLDKAATSNWMSKIIKEDISPILNEEVSTDQNIRDGELQRRALGLETEIRNGIKRQERSINSIGSIEQVLETTKPQSSQDGTITDIQYQLELLKTPYIQTLEFDLFNKFIIDELAPFCVLNIGEVKQGSKVVAEKRWFKVHANNGQNQRISRFKNVSWMGENTSLSMIFFIYTGDDPSKAKTAGFNKFVKVVYSFKKGNPFKQKDPVFHALTFSYKNNTSLIVERIRKKLPGFTFGNLSIRFIKEKYLIPHVVLDRNIFVHAITTDPAFATMFRMSEINEPFAMKRRLTFTIFLIGETTIGISMGKIKNNFERGKENGKDVALLQNDKFLSISISSLDKRQINITKLLVNVLIKSYINKYDELFKFYKTFFKDHPRIKPFIKPKEEIDDTLPGFESILGFRTKEIKRSVDIVKQLKAVDPEVFGSKYARRAGQSYDRNINNKVIYIRPSEVRQKQKEGCQVILWPVRVEKLPERLQATRYYDFEKKTGTAHFYTCSSSGAPKIKLMLNCDSKIMGKFPTIIKCVSQGENIDIDQKTFRVTLKIPLENHSKHKGQKLVIQKVGRESGAIPGKIPHLFKVKRLIRLGMKRSKSSLIDCIMYSLFEEFRIIFDKREGEEEILLRRRSLGNFADVCAQENPGVEIEEIRRKLVDPNVFLDPFLYYRALEEAFGCYIYTLVVEKEVLVLSAPNHIKSYPKFKKSSKRPVIVIAKLESSDSDCIKETQCELIIQPEESRIQTKNLERLSFGPAELKILDQGLRQMTKTISLKPVIWQNESGLPVQAVSFLDSPKRLFSISILKGRFNVKSQWIDTKGKLRCINLDVHNYHLSLLTEPLEPLNGVKLEKPSVGTLRGFKRLIEFIETKEIRYIPEETKTLLVDREIIEEVEEVEEVGGGASTKAKGPRKKIIEEVDAGAGSKKIGVKGKTVKLSVDTKITNLGGIWVEFGEASLQGLQFYIPLKPTKWLEEYNDSIRTDKMILIKNTIEISKTQEYYQKRKIALILIQIIKRLYIKFARLIEEQEFVENFNPVDDFIDQYTDIDENFIPTLKNNNLQNNDFPRIVPDLKFEDLLIRFSDMFPRLFHEDGSRLVFNSEKLSNNIIVHLKSLQKQRNRKRQTNGTTNKIDDSLPFLEKYYESPQDFEKMSKGQLIFMSEERFDYEMDIDLADPRKAVEIIQLSLKTSVFPYFYNHRNRGLFIVQNVKNGDKNRAITVIEFWKRQLINIGFNASEGNQTMKIKTIPSSGAGIKNINESYLIQYSNRKEYGALLSISNVTNKE